MHRITNNLFESIKEVISVDKEKEPVLLNEKVEELDELKKSTLGNYIKRASSDAANKMHDASAYASIATNAQKTDASSKEWMSAVTTIVKSSIFFIPSTIEPGPLSALCTFNPFCCNASINLGSLVSAIIILLASTK